MSVRTSPLHARHESLGARFTEFAGWQMPLSYRDGPIAEHHATRSACTLFDTSHMGRLRVAGSGAASWLSGLLTADITTLAAGSARYALVCREDGGIIDDLLVYRTGEETFLVVVNAARRAVDLHHFTHHPPSTGVELKDESDDSAMIALQGPLAHAVAATLAGDAGARMPRFAVRAATVQLDNGPAVVEIARTGYTGEDGFELFCGAADAVPLWDALAEAAARAGVALVPAGLAARDSLRLEAGFPLYGHELTEEVTPVEARMLWACDLDHEFIGRAAILERRSAGGTQTLVRLVTDGGVPRHGQSVVAAGIGTVGTVASGGRAPTLGTFVATAFVDESVAADGAAELAIEIRDHAVAVRRARGPFYRSGYRRLSPHRSLLLRSGEFVARHIGPSAGERDEMLASVGAASLEALIDETVPSAIRRTTPLELPPALAEDEAVRRLRTYAARNRMMRNLIGQGYNAAITPTAIQRMILENPRWYTQYTPYQAELAQGRLEALLNFQTMIESLTAMPVANASMLDEATAVGEAVTMAWRQRRVEGRPRVLVDRLAHPQTIAHLETRLAVLDIDVLVAPPDAWQPGDRDIAGVVQYPGTDGSLPDGAAIVDRLHRAGALAVVAADPLALAIYASPGEWGADIVVGSTQRFGLPMWNGGPHAAYLATRDELVRLMPGRLVGVSRDAHGRPALRLARQTREQHIRRDRATSNICTAQALPAIAASMYAVYHGPEGLERIARRIRLLAHTFRQLLQRAGVECAQGERFDTIEVIVGSESRPRLLAEASLVGFNLRPWRDDRVIVALDERTDLEELGRLAGVFGVLVGARDLEAIVRFVDLRVPYSAERRAPLLTERVFNSCRSETELMRYIGRLERRDLSLVDGMIPLGSCTMKLNPASAMAALLWPGFADIHPFAPPEQTPGYRRLIDDLADWLCRITDFAGCTFQPPSGAQGEYTGLLMIRSWHRSRGDTERVVCLVPASAHGTNPASAAMAGFEVQVVATAHDGSIDLDDLRVKADAAAHRLAALMVTYPSTHGVFEPGIRDAVAIVHERGGQVYLDGANMNAQVGLTSPGVIGADVCHLNLHKTFAIPHGGGGPGVGPVLCAAHLVPFLPGTPGEPGPTGTVAAAPHGSAGILSVSWAYIAMLGSAGLTRATEGAILAANYIARRLGDAIRIAYSGAGGRVAHECILDFRRVEKDTGVTVEDIAKRLADFGFHAPTMSWPLHGSLMVEPTESESKLELDRFCDAMLAIVDEIRAIERGEIALEESPLRAAPHSESDLVEPWTRSYPSCRAIVRPERYPDSLFRTPINRVDNVWGDRNLVCSCAPLEEWQEAAPTAMDGGA